MYKKSGQISPSLYLTEVYPSPAVNAAVEICRAGLDPEPAVKLVLGLPPDVAVLPGVSEALFGSEGARDAVVRVVGMAVVDVVGGVVVDVVGGAVVDVVGGAIVDVAGGEVI